MKVRFPRKKPKYDIVMGAKITHICTSFVFLFAGIFLIVFPNADMEAVRWIAGAVLILCGGAKMQGYFSNDLYRLAFQFDLALGAFPVILGVLIWTLPQERFLAIPYMLSAYVILDGLSKLQTAFDARKFGMTMWIGLLISAVLVVTWGILVAFLPKEEAYYMTLLGIALAFDGAENIWNTMYTVRVRAKSEHAEDRYGSLESKTWAAAKEHLEELNQRIASEKRQKKDGTK